MVSERDVLAAVHVRVRRNVPEHEMTETARRRQPPITIRSARAAALLRRLSAGGRSQADIIQEALERMASGRQTVAQLLAPKQPQSFDWEPEPSTIAAMTVTLDDSCTCSTPSSSPKAASLGPAVSIRSQSAWADRYRGNVPLGNDGLRARARRAPDGTARSHTGLPLRRCLDNQVLAADDGRILPSSAAVPRICAGLHVPDPRSEGSRLDRGHRDRE